MSSHLVMHRHDVGVEGAARGQVLPAALALVVVGRDEALLAQVRRLVVLELDALREGGVAAGEVALVGPLVRVQHAVLGQRLLRRQRLPADVANLSRNYP